MKLTLTQHTVRCPFDDRPARLTVQTDPDSPPSRRHRDVTACSLWTPTSFVPAARRGYFSDVAPPVPYLSEVDPAPRHSLEIACSARCLSVLNAAESGPAKP